MKRIKFEPEAGQSSPDTDQVARVILPYSAHLPALVPPDPLCMPTGLLDTSLDTTRGSCWQGCGILLSPPGQLTGTCHMRVATLGGGDGEIKTILRVIMPGSP